MATDTLPVVHRRSALEAFRCPRRYRALYVDNVPDESAAARRGSAFHAAAQRYIGALRRAGESDNLELAAEALKAALIETVTPAHLVADVTDIFWRWAETFELNLDALLVVEQRQLSAEGHSWTPDLVYAHDDVLEIRDWKTHHSAFTEAQAHQEFQARWYLWQASQLWPGFKTYRIVFVFVRYGFEVSAEFDQADLDQMDAQVDAIVGAIDRAAVKNDWPAIAGAHCAYCTLTCPLVDDPERVELRLVTREDAERLAGLKLALDRSAKLAGEALRGWCEANGPVTVGGMEFAHRAAPTTQFPIDQVWQVLSDQGITPTFRVSKSTLRSYLETKRFAHVRPLLEPLAITTPGTEFRARKTGSVGEEPRSE